MCKRSKCSKCLEMTFRDQPGQQAWCELAGSSCVSVDMGYVKMGLERRDMDCCSHMGINLLMETLWLG